MEKAEFFREARRDSPGPLAGVRVLEATTTWAGPMCGCLLADFGADVVKVEHPAGEIARRSPPFLPGSDPPLSFMHETVNRNKRSLALDLHGDAGRALFVRLAAQSDVVIENFRPGTADAWGIGYAAVRAARPDVIYVSISGFGQWGPDHDRVGYDPLAQAASGFLSLNGSPDGEPVKSPTFLADDLAGLHAALAALAALRHRDRTGEGQHVDVVAARRDAVPVHRLSHARRDGRRPAAARQPVPRRRARQHLSHARRIDPRRRAARCALAPARRAARPRRARRRPALCDGARADRAPRRGGCAAGGLGARAHQRRGARGAARREHSRRARAQLCRGGRRSARARARHAPGVRAPRRARADHRARGQALAHARARRGSRRASSAPTPRPCSPSSAWRSDERRALRDAGVVAGPLSSENPD